MFLVLDFSKSFALRIEFLPKVPCIRGFKRGHKELLKAVVSGQFGEIGLYFIFLKIHWSSSHNGVVHKDAEVSN